VTGSSFLWPFRSWASQTFFFGFFFFSAAASAAAFSSFFFQGALVLRVSFIGVDTEVSFGPTNTAPPPSSAGHLIFFDSFCGAALFLFRGIRMVSLRRPFFVGRGASVSLSAFFPSFFRHPPYTPRVFFRNFFFLLCYLLLLTVPFLMC